MSLHSFDFTVSGKVQGVYFRVFAKEIADTAGLKGYVKNDFPENTVSGVAQGDLDGLKKFEDAINRGPAAAQVTKVELTNKREITEFEYQDFAVIRWSRSF